MSSAMPGLGAHVGQVLLTPIADLGCVASVVPVTSSTAICSGLSVHRRRTHPSRMGTKSRETIYGASVRAAAERATEARKEADQLAVEAWNKRMLGFQGPAQPSPVLGDALNAG